MVPEACQGADQEVTELELSDMGSGGDVIVSTVIMDDDPEWDQFFQYQKAVMKIYELEEELADLRVKYEDLFVMLNSMTIITPDNGFATYIPRNRRGSE